MDRKGCDSVTDSVQHMPFCRRWVSKSIEDDGWIDKVTGNLDVSTEMRRYEMKVSTTYARLLVACSSGVINVGYWSIQ